MDFFFLGNVLFIEIVPC